MPYKDKERLKAWKVANGDKVKAYKSRYRKANQEKCQDSQLRGRFGISLAQYSGMCDQQGWVCGICSEVLEDKTGRGRTLHVDHIHGTDIVRGLLCGLCNPGLGNFRDSPELLRKAAAYVERHTQRPPLVKGMRNYHLFSILSRTA